VPGLRTTSLPSPAMLAMPPNQGPPDVAEDCQPILDSYDPNDKQVEPQGRTAEHYTPPTAPLHYQIRFQNTGSDVAYQVVVVDTLAADLDLRTLQLGAVSHPYRLTLSGQQRPVLTFTFDHILLPDSTHHKAGSTGVVQFSIQPKAGLPARTRIDNYADIFFDYNPAVRTNTTTNRLYEVPAVLDPAVALSYPAVLATSRSTQLPGLALWPNPAHTATLVQLPAVAGATQATLVLRDALGRQVRTELVRLPPAGTVHELRVAGLPPGLYLLQVQAGTATAVRQLAVE
jgi:hypothetical protein